jgi:antitoxin component YwqK of YwqJK toxin-antitoxin module
MNELDFVKQKFPIRKANLPSNVVYYILLFLTKKGSRGFRFDGKKHGIWREYYASGNLWYEHTWNDGEPDGVWVDYDENGELKYYINYSLMLSQ